METGNPARPVSPYDALLRQMVEVVDVLARAAAAMSGVDVGAAQTIHQHCAEQIHGGTAVPPGWPEPPTPRVVTIGEDRYKIESTSCRCGGSWAWLRERPSGAWEMVGCVCHHLPDG